MATCKGSGSQLLRTRDLSFRVYREEGAARLSEAQKHFPFGSLAHT